MRMDCIEVVSVPVAKECCTLPAEVQYQGPSGERVGGEGGGEREAEGGYEGRGEERESGRGYSNYC